MKQLSIIMPCYQSAGYFDTLIQEMTDLLPALEKLIQVEFVLVDDGSTDHTFQEILRFKSIFPKTKAIQLRANYGAHNAFLAGLTHAEGDCFAILHPDLQDPPQHLLKMIPLWQQGNAWVIGQRAQRKDKVLDRFFASVYHSLIHTIALPQSPPGSYDLILFDKQIRDKLVELQETNVSQVYLIASFKFPYQIIPISRLENKLGKSTWTFQKKAKLFMDSLVGFSYFPIQLLSFLAMLLGLVFFVLTISNFIYWFQSGSLSISRVIIWIVSTFAFVLGAMLAIVGEYLWRAIELNRKRPAYFVQSFIDY
ncbi:MAG: glycosyltransferase [Bacteroidia bacterium]|nr:glycosyltransferase [Bacteroidia bacterium]